MKKHKQQLEQYIKELKELREDEAFKEKVFHLDGSPNSPYLILYSKVIQKYFDTKNTEELKDFNFIKEYAKNLIKEKNISNKEYEKLEEKYNKIFEEHEDKFLLDTIIFKKYNCREYFDITEKLNDLIVDYTEEEKELIYKILKYNNNKSKIEKEIIELELEYILLTEYIYINKFDKLIKKIIHKNTQNRYISSSVSGTISSSNTEKNNQSKYNKDDLLNLVKREALSYAMEGFLIGMRRYDISMGNQLSTYMTWWLEQRVIYYIEKDSTLNKATKIIDNLKHYSFEDAENEDFRFHKFDNIKYSNYNFQDIDDMSNSITESEDNFFNNVKTEVVYDILIFFCKYKDIFMYHEYLLIKYDLLLENFIYFIDINPKQEIIDCFYKDINIFIRKLQKQEGYENLEEFTKVTEFYKISELLETYFNVEHSDFLSIKRSLKQKFINMLNKIFTDTEPE
jgi:hypothetical protein